MPSIPRSEYPRPQFRRDEWLCLNGQWEFEIDHGDSGFERGLSRPFDRAITVPFCPESTLSGIGYTDRMLAVWYRRSVPVPEAWAGKRIVLHFGAVDYDATVWVNGVEVGRHRGGFTPFRCDITDAVAPGAKAVVTVRARDDWAPPQPRGKQVPIHGNCGCHYTRTTGIWQTVWMEPVAACALERTRITPDVANGCFHLEQPLTRVERGMTVTATLSDAKGVVAKATVATGLELSPRLTVPIPVSRRRLWSCGDPHLYALRLELRNSSGVIIDRVESYAGLRSVAIDGMAVVLNGKPVFQRLVLDQGYYPDGIMTAPSDQALVKDIELSLAAGFNGARLHQKVFEERFLYHADRMGYLCWGEFGDWSWSTLGHLHDERQWGATYAAQWLEALERDYSHPSIVGWCPMNETSYRIEDTIHAHDDLMRALYLATKAMDTSRPVLDVSGYSHRVAESDIYDSHDYEQDPATFAVNQAGLRIGKPFINHSPGQHNIPYRGQPYFVSEFGGIWWNPDLKPGEPSWGYGNKPQTVEEFHLRFAGLCAVLLDDPRMFGYCYTQLTDVFQEQNGVVRFDRSLKLDLARLRAAQARPAAIELAGITPISVTAATKATSSRRAKVKR